jgi:hypothetical protein
MVWLAEHGYLNFQDTIRAEALDQAVLSRRGFLLLTSRSELGLVTPADSASVPPSVAEQSLSNISQLRAALREGSSIKLQQCISYLLSQPPIGGQ